MRVFGSGFTKHQAFSAEFDDLIETFLQVLRSIAFFNSNNSGKGSFLLWVNNGFQVLDAIFVRTLKLRVSIDWIIF
jgi:hypothetical protein